MDTTLKTSLLAAALFVGSFANSSSAQDVINAKIPFSFVVGREEFPAGQYQFTTSQSVLTIRGRDNDAGMYAMVNPADGRDPHGTDPALVFHRYEKTYRLTDIWSSENQGSSLLMRRHRRSEWPLASTKDKIVISPTDANEPK
jgi:hypothetical protein